MFNADFCPALNDITKFGLNDFFHGLHQFYVEGTCSLEFKKQNKEPKFKLFVVREVNKPLIVKINSDVLKDHDGLNILHYQKIFNKYSG